MYNKPAKNHPRKQAMSHLISSVWLPKIALQGEKTPYGAHSEVFINRAKPPEPTADEDRKSTYKQEVV